MKNRRRHRRQVTRPVLESNLLSSSLDTELAGAFGIDNGTDAPLPMFGVVIEDVEQEDADKEPKHWETPCPVQEDRKHCNCWYDGDACCSCGAGPVKQEEINADEKPTEG